jgi:hypothetical protein
MTLSTRLIASLAALALGAVLLVWGPAACTSFFTAKKQVEVSKARPARRSTAAPRR